MIFHNIANVAPQMPDPNAMQQQAPSSNLQEVDHVRSVFPETWLWSNATLRYSIYYYLYPIFCQSYCYVLLKKLEHGLIPLILYILYDNMLILE